jgi:hypothetical protein
MFSSRGIQCKNGIPDPRPYYGRNPAFLWNFK